MTEEIGRLGLLVNEFDHPFHPHPGFLKTYKKVTTMYSSIHLRYTTYNLKLFNFLTDRFQNEESYQELWDIVLNNDEPSKSHNYSW